MDVLYKERKEKKKKEQPQEFKKKIGGAQQF